MKFLYEFSQKDTRRVFLDAASREEAEKLVSSMFAEDLLSFDDTVLPGEPLEAELQLSDGETTPVKYEYQNSADTQFDYFLLRTES